MAETFEAAAGLNRYDAQRKIYPDWFAFAEFMIIGCKHKDWWYYPFCGESFIGRITPKLTIREVNVVAFRGSKIVIGRSVAIEDVIML